MSTQNVSELNSILTNIDCSIYAISRFINTLNFYMEDFQEFKRDHGELDAECLELLDRVATPLRHSLASVVPKLCHAYYNVFAHTFNDYVHTEWSEEDQVYKLKTPEKGVKDILSNDAEKKLFVLETAAIAIQNTFVNRQVIKDLQNEPEAKSLYCAEIAESIDRLSKTLSSIISKRPEDNVESVASPVLQRELTREIELPEPAVKKQLDEEKEPELSSKIYPTWWSEKMIREEERRQKLLKELGLKKSSPTLTRERS